MTFDEAMNKFFKSYSPESREKVESDISYRESKGRGDHRRAAEIACEILEGTVQSPFQGRRIRKEKMEFKKLCDDLGI